MPRTLAPVASPALEGLGVAGLTTPLALALVAGPAVEGLEVAAIIAPRSLAPVAGPLSRVLKSPASSCPAPLPLSPASSCPAPLPLLPAPLLLLSLEASFRSSLTLLAAFFFFLHSLDALKCPLSPHVLHVLLSAGHFCPGLCSYVLFWH